MNAKDAEQAVQRPKRFWTAVSFEALPDAGFEIHLDGKAVKTPGGHRLTVPTEALAELIAGEWEAVEETVDYAEMLMTRLAASVQDHLSANRAAVVGELVRYAGTDALCYFSDAPKALFEKEVEVWVPILEWAEETLGFEFTRTTGVIHTPQPLETLSKVETWLEGLSDYELAGMAQLTPLLGSLILALAVFKGQLSGDGAFEVSCIGETFQSGIWGEDAEAKARAEALAYDANLLETWFAALDPTVVHD